MSETAPEVKPDAPLDDRVTALETGQDSLSGKIDEILGIIKGSKQDPPAEPVTTADPAPADMAEQMRQAVRDVHAERDQADAGKHTPVPEKPPREAGQPARQKLASVLYGKEPKK